MRQRVARGCVWTALLVASLGSAWSAAGRVACVAGRRASDRQRRTSPSADRTRRAARATASGSRKSARRLGVDFVHQAPTFDAQLEHIMPQVASMGAAVAVADFDRDGWQDFYVTNSAEGSLNRLYRNQGDGTFTDVAPADGRRRREPRRHRRVDGRRLGRLRQRRLRGSASSTSTAAPSCFTTSRGSASRVSASAPACRRGSTPTAPSGSTTTATAGSICSSPATGPRTSISGT